MWDQGIRVFVLRGKFNLTWENVECNMWLKTNKFKICKELTWIHPICGWVGKDVGEVYCNLKKEIKKEVIIIFLINWLYNDNNYRIELFLTSWQEVNQLHYY